MLLFPCLPSQFRKLHPSSITLSVGLSVSDAVRRAPYPCASSFSILRRPPFLASRMEWPLPSALSLLHKHECSQNITNLQTNIPFCHIINRIKDTQIFIQHLSLILSKITNLYVVPDGQFTFVWDFVHYTFHQSGLTFPILSDKSHLWLPYALATSSQITG